MLLFWGERRTAEADPAGPSHGAESLPSLKGPLWLGALLALVGLALAVVGADQDGSIKLARAYHVPEAVIGLTIVAIGTSLPELATTVAAAFKRQGDLALGNILGSNIFNVLGILGITALVIPISVPPGILAYDLWIMAGITVLLFVFALNDGRISRTEGGVLLLLYGIYLGFLGLRAVNVL